MKNRENVQQVAPKRKRKRKLRSEAVVVLTLGALLLFLVTSMGISLVARFIQPVEEQEVVAQRNPSDKQVIVIDPGHGGIDTGCNHGDIYEKDITLKIANYMGNYLKENNYEVIYTRESDIMLADYELADLENRVAVGVNQRADYFISIHINSTDIESERIHGFEIYANESIDASMKLAASINNELTTLKYTESRGIKDGNVLHVVYTNPIPSALVEIGYMDDEADRAYITSEEGIKNIGESMAKSVIATK